MWRESISNTFMPNEQQLFVIVNQSSLDLDTHKRAYQEAKNV